MKMRITFALLGGMLLSMLFTSTASASFTVNGQSNVQTYVCKAPCTIEAYNPDGGSYDWDFESNQHDGFVRQASGNPVSWTYQTVGGYYIQQSDGQQVIATAFIDVRTAEDAVPEDLSLVSPTSGSIPREIEFTTSRRQVLFDLCGACEGQPVGTTGPDASGLYHHFLRINQVDSGTFPIEFGILVYVWNDDTAYAIEQEFRFMATGQDKPFSADSAHWKVQRKGNRCVVKFSKGFSVSGPYTVELKLLGKVRALRVGRTVRKTGQDGASRVRGKLVLRPLFIHKLPGKAIARLKVTVDSKSYFTKDKLTLKTCR